MKGHKMSVRYIIKDSHKNMSQKRRENLIDFFCEVKGPDREAAEKAVEFCDWYESEYAVKWFEVLALSDGDIAGYLRCFRTPDDIRQWFIGDVSRRNQLHSLLGSGSYRNCTSGSGSISVCNLQCCNGSW